MSILERIQSPADLRSLARDELHTLADEIRARLIDVCSRTGGHIGAGLGVVELTVALHAAFETPRDQLLWDVGHQGYPHKLLSGRNERLETLRQENGISGFLKRTESEYDVFGAGHAATAISAALGVAAGRDLRHEKYKVIAVVGDGALTCGLAYEGLNNAGHSERDVIVVLNDNEMSIAPNVGAISKYLTSVQRNSLYNRVRSAIGDLADNGPGGLFSSIGLGTWVRRWEESLKALLTPGVLFEELGFRYFGPIDGHDIDAMIETFSAVRDLGGPRLVHVRTQKGKGFPAGESLEKWHALPPDHDPSTGKLRHASAATTYQRVFGKGLAELGAENDRIVAITAAMPSGTSTDLFAKAHPSRFFDVGIAEAHAVTFAAGLATRGIRPVVAIYSTFLQRAYDSIIPDVAIQSLPVIFCLDRAGLVGEDGETHMGLYDIAYLLAVPNMTVTAPKDGAELIGLLRCGLAHADGPFSIRYPRDRAPGEAPPAAEVAPVPYGTWELLRKGRECALLAVGAMCQPALAAAESLAADGLDVSVVNCRFMKPVDRELLDHLLRDHRLLVTVEDGTVTNGFGAQMAGLVATVAPEVRVAVLGAPDRIYEHAPRAQQLAEVGLSGTAIAARVRALAAEESPAHS